MNILFLHGLESKLSDAKRAILENYGTVIAPDIDYKSNSNAIQNLYDEYHNQDINVIIGSSMGGFAAYHLANSIGLCALLYNPALPYRNNIEQIIPSTLPINNSIYMRIVLGGQDDIIQAKDNLAFLSQNYQNLKDCTIEILNELAHQIPVAIFEEQTKTFFKKFVC
ncbi:MULTISPECIES: YqiA/YcfP family alpha/beta fold hydrolase [unclassified Flavobacterium]|uniref:YqiA/YcfP family alpha/beta fold hydrolase n=1 Tax=unclassified Flavobacterium TaxID=196869 RepID=UPI003F8E5FBB